MSVTSLLPLTLLFALFSLPAHALTLSNCDAVERTVTVDYYGELVEATLLPGQTRNFFGRAREISIGEQSIYLMHHNVEFCVRDGLLKLQRRKRNNKRIR